MRTDSRDRNQRLNKWWRQELNQDHVSFQGPSGLQESSSSIREGDQQRLGKDLSLEKRLSRISAREARVEDEASVPVKRKADFRWYWGERPMRHPGHKWRHLLSDTCRCNVIAWEGDILSVHPLSHTTQDPDS